MDQSPDAHETNQGWAASAPTTPTTEADESAAGMGGAEGGTVGSGASSAAEAPVLANPILDRANALITGDRAEQYGDYNLVTERIADGWSAITNSYISPREVTLMLIWLKVARLIGNTRHQDSWVDIAGYAGLSDNLY